MTDPITTFRGTHYFLSNFYDSPVDMDGIDYPTVEHAYQAAKTADPAVRAKVRKLETPKAAKDVGRRIKRREDWFDVNLAIMEALIKQKFTRYRDLGVKLLETGDAQLVEGNNWNDKFFGAVWDSKKNEWVGENHLGKLLMKVRQDLARESGDKPSETLKRFHHRSLPDYSALLSGHLPPDELAFQSDHLQIWYNNTEQVWSDNGSHAHEHSDECFIVLKGSLVVEVEGERFTIQPREFCCFPRGIYHAVVEVHPPVETLMIRAPSVDDKHYRT